MELSGERAEAEVSAKALRLFLNCSVRDHKGVICLEESESPEK